MVLELVLKSSVVFCLVLSGTVFKLTAPFGLCSEIGYRTRQFWGHSLKIVNFSWSLMISEALFWLCNSLTSSNYLPPLEHIKLLIDGAAPACKSLWVFKQSPNLDVSHKSMLVSKLDCT